jgi:hypothetical protein
MDLYTRIVRAKLFIDDQEDRLGNWFSLTRRSGNDQEISLNGINVFKRKGYF